MIRLNEKKFVDDAVEKKKRIELMQDERELNVMKRQEYGSQQRQYNKNLEIFVFIDEISICPHL